MKKRLFLLMVVVLLLFMTGCEKTKLIDKISDASANIDSYTFDMDGTINMKVSLEGITQTAVTRNVGSGAVDVNARQMMIKSTISSDQGVIDSEVYIIGDTLYSKDPIQGWVKQAVSADVWNQQDQIQKQVDLLRNSKIKKLGDDTVNGIPTIMLEVIPDTKKLVGLIQGEQLNLPADVDWNKVFKNIYIKQWIDKDTYYPIKSQTTVGLLLNKDTVGGTAQDVEVEMNIDIVMTMDNFNRPVEITLPDEALGAAEVAALI
ncbi:hypothetical protein DRJ17_02240 [Candidatus Woesearchaeota archaeon]|nr:MAG: hypothetical protein DRJ17_02240 [Candidatus Woesearchaeota archaeon]